MSHQAQLLLERLPLVTYTLRREAPSEPVYVSPQVETTFGFRPDDFVAGGFWTSRIVDDDRAAFVDALERLRRTGEPMAVEYRVVGTGGTPVWVRDIASADDELVYGYLVDITREKELEDAGRRYLHLIEQLPLAVYVNDVEPRRRATYVSPRIEELTGYTQAELLADAGLGERLIHPDDLDDVVARERSSSRLGVDVVHEYRIIRADGAVRWVLDRMETVADDAGNPLYEQGFLVDVTDLHETAALLRGVWDGALDAIVIADADGRYVDANPAACELFGRAREELCALHVDDVLPAGTWASWVQRGCRNHEYTFVRPDGEPRTIESVSQRDVLPGLHLAVLRDVTERRQLERDLWRAQKLESVARLAGGVAHDFNNLLTAIRGYAQLLQSRVEPGSVEQHHAAEIDRVVDRAAALTAQLLALGRRQTLRARPLDLNRHLETARDALVELVGARTELVFDLDPALRAVRVDGGLLARAIASLVGNAAEAMPDGGLVVVRTANADVAGRDDLADGSYVVVSIEDSGRGLDETTLEHVFEPFFTTKEVGGGSGLGLASAYGTVKQSGGTITVESAPGRGSTFSIWLPEAAAGDSEPVRYGDGETILVVERDPAVRDVLFGLLTDASYRVLTTRTAAEAVRLAERHDGPVDLVLTDVEERSESLLAALRVERPAVRALSLAKPYTPDRIHPALRAALDATDRVRRIPVSG